MGESEFLNGFPDFLDGFSSDNFGRMCEEFMCIKNVGFAFDFGCYDAWNGGVEVDATNRVETLEK